MKRQMVAALMSVCLAGELVGGTMTPAMVALQFVVDPGEYWWGAWVSDGNRMPFSAGTVYSASAFAGMDGDSPAAGLLVSSRGRFVWSDAPFAFSLTGGVMRAEGPAPVMQGRSAEATLRGAFRAAARAHFPASGKMPDEFMFSTPQWNTWIELTYNQNQAGILAYAEAIVAHGFKPGVLMIDDTWQANYGVWRFDPRRFSDPKAMCDRLHALGFKVLLWVCPMVSPDSWEYRNELFNELRNERENRNDCGVLMDVARPGRVALFQWWNGYSTIVDFSAPVGMGWFRTQLGRLEKDYGVDGFKFDGPGLTTYSRERFAAHDPAAANPAAQMHLYNTLTRDFPLHESSKIWNCGGQPIVRRLGDKNHRWRDLRGCVTDMLAQGLAGYPFGLADMVGGGNWASFLPNGDAFEPKLFVRFAQAHALMPMMQFSAAPWRVLDAAHLAAVKKAVAVRQAHAPRILELARESARTGEPIVRPLAYVFPGAGLEAVNDEFVLGDDLIVAPVLDADDARKVVLPAGTWRADDGTSSTGPATFTLRNVPLDRLPYFERIQK